MSTARRRRSRPKGLEVHVNMALERRAWARYWGCSQRDIRDAVNAAGIMVADVQDWLKVNVVR